jgi:rRNA small subunit pseudouridine methyltransferase Nep1
MIAEAGLELVPSSIQDHPSVKNYAKKIGRRPDEVLLQTSYHFRAMIERKLPFWWKRGRPDIIHFSLLTALSTPLFMERKLNVYISTLQDKLILIDNDLRLPKSYSRFEGVIMNLFKDRVIRDPSNKTNLIELKDNITFEEAIHEVVRPDKTIGFSINGSPSSLNDVITENVKDAKNYCFVVGGFQRGHFGNDITRTLDRIYAISHYGLESHIVIARILYECEKLT